MSGRWGAMGPPDVLPFGYGEYTGGEFGRLSVMGPDPDTRITTQAPYRTWDNSHGINRGDPNLPAYAATVPSLAPVRAPIHSGGPYGYWAGEDEANGEGAADGEGEAEESWAAKQWRKSQERRAKGEGWFQEGSTGRALLTSGVSLFSKDKESGGSTFIPATTNGGGGGGGGRKRPSPGRIRGPGPRNLLAQQPPAKAGVPWVSVSVAVAALGGLAWFLRRRAAR